MNIVEFLMYDRLFNGKCLYHMISHMFINYMVISLLHWKHFIRNFRLYHLIFPLLFTSQVNNRDQYYIQYYHSKVLHSAFHQFHSEFLTVICNSIIYDYTSSAIWHVLESCYTYVITFSWWFIGARSWLTSFVLVLFRSTKRWNSSSRPNYILIYGYTWSDELLYGVSYNMIGRLDLTVW